MPRPRVLIVEDEPSIAETLVYALRTDGFEPQHSLTGAEGLEALARTPPALVLLDVGLPDMNGFEWCKRVRQTNDVPIVFLTARSDEIDRIVGLEIGGDDYVTKPFSPREVAARVKAILRRGGLRHVAPAASPTVAPSTRAVDLEVDTEACVVRFKGVALELTRYEYRLLVALTQRPGRVFSRDALMQAVWEDPGASMERTVDAHIKMLRAKLRAVSAESVPIATHRGLGYSWTARS